MNPYPNKREKIRQKESNKSKRKKVISKDKKCKSTLRIGSRGRKSSKRNKIYYLKCNHGDKDKEREKMM
jgi:hypothetical protein